MNIFFKIFLSLAAIAVLSSLPYTAIAAEEAQPPATSVDLPEEQCVEAEPVACAECPPAPICPEALSLESNTIILSPEIEANATFALDVLREETTILLKAKKADKDYVTAFIAETDNFMDMYRELSLSAEALLIKADLYRLNKLYEARLVTLSKLLFEYPDSEFAEKAVIGIRGLFTGKLKKALKFDKGLSKGTSADKKQADRYAEAIGLLHEFKDNKFRPFIMAEYKEFLRRYPRHEFAEQVLLFKSEGYSEMKEFESAAFSLIWLIKLYPESSMRSTALFDLALIYEERMKEYERSVQTYEWLVKDYPDGEQTLSSYQRAAVLYDKKLRNPAGAIKKLEAIVTKYPGDKASLEAFIYMSGLYSSQKQYADSVKSLNRLASMFKGSDDAVKALEESTKIASGKMKDYELQILVQNRIVDEYPDREEAIKALDSIAATNAKQLGNTADAINVYKILIKQYPDHKLAKAAVKKVDKLLGQ